MMIFTLHFIYFPTILETHQQHFKSEQHAQRICTHFLFNLLFTSAHTPLFLHDMFLFSHIFIPNLSLAFQYISFLSISHIIPISFLILFVFLYNSRIKN